MEKDSALYQLMDTRMHSVMNGIVSSDGEYQAILRKSDIYSGELDRMDLSKEIRLLIDRYVSEQNALGSRFGMERQGCLPDIVRVWFIGYMRPLNLFLVHEIPIRLHTVLVICRRLFLAQQLHVANLLLEHIHEIRPVI